MQPGSAGHGARRKMRPGDAGYSAIPAQLRVLFLRPYKSMMKMWNSKLNVPFVNTAMPLMHLTNILGRQDDLTVSRTSAALPLCMRVHASESGLHKCHVRTRVWSEAKLTALDNGFEALDSQKINLMIGSADFERRHSCRVRGSPPVL